MFHVVGHDLGSEIAYFGLELVVPGLAGGFACRSMSLAVSLTDLEAASTSLTASSLLAKVDRDACVEGVLRHPYDSWRSTEQLCKYLIVVQHVGRDL